MRTTRAPAASSKSLSADHKHLSALVIALIILCCVGFLVVYYKVDLDGTMEAGSLSRIERRLERMEARAAAMARMKQEKMRARGDVLMPVPDGQMPGAPQTVPYSMPSPALPEAN